MQPLSFHQVIFPSKGDGIKPTFIIEKTPLSLQETMKKHKAVILSNTAAVGQNTQNRGIWQVT